MLQALSGREHKVITAITLRDNKRCHTSSDTAIVFFNNLSNNEIEYYIDNYKPFDKAGAYGIQGYASRWISRIDGCYFGVVGMSVNTLDKLHRELTGAPIK